MSRAPAVHPGYGAPIDIFQPRKPAFWVFAALVTHGVLRFVGDILPLVHLYPTGVILSLTLYGLYTVPFFYLLYKLDLFEREPAGAVVMAFAWGAFGATGLAVVANNAFLSLLAKTESPTWAGEWGAAIVGPTDEETLKYLGLILIVLIAPYAISSTLDGFIYGAIIGLGFQVVENVYYAVEGIVVMGGVPGSEVGSVILSFIARGLINGLWSHALYTGLTGMGLGWAVSHREKPMIFRIGVAAIAFAAGWSFHFFWNSPVLSPLFILKGLTFLGVIAVLYVMSRRQEGQWIRGALEPEVAGGFVTEQEIHDLLTIRARRAARKRAKHQGGKKAQKLTTELQHAQVGLAVAKLRTGDPLDPECVRCRASIASIRSALAALPAPHTQKDVSPAAG